MDYRYYTADVFTDRAFGGNPLAVIPDATGLSSEQMQRIAREFNYSETTFVLPPDDPTHTRKVRIFTPGEEVPFAGHPTVGTAHVLASIGEVTLTGDQTEIILEEGVGPVPVKITARAGEPVFAQLTAAMAPEFGPEPPPPVETIAAAVSLEPGDIMIDPDGDRPRTASCGLPFLFVPVRDRAALGRASVNRAAWRALDEFPWASLAFVFSRDPERAGADIRARMFAPPDIEEDPATGSACAALAGYLGAIDAREDASLAWVVEQGVEMGRPSVLYVEADRCGGVVTSSRVGGGTVMVMEGTIHVPDENDG